EDYHGTLLVPDFDMLSDEEKQAVANYRNGGVVCTAPDGFDLTAYNIQPKFQITDRFSNHPLTAFMFGADISREVIDKIEALLSVDDGTANTEPADLGDHYYTLIDTLSFVKVTTGFRDAIALLLKAAQGDMITCDMPYIANKLTNGAWRLYIFNTVNEHYRHAFVTINKPVADVRIVSSFPVLPVRFIENKSGNLTHKYTGDPVNKQNFELKLQPGGVTILDVELEG
ncbi:MAG: hypothetical protein FWF15_03815, partial [Oscillospiraceae bacterium]|nr:hypothetical protein [Oscillospiraceae bacterium]